MINRVSIGRSIAMFLYGIGAVFAIYIGSLIFMGDVMFDVRGLILSSMMVCIPSGIATYLLIKNTQNVATKYRIMDVFMAILLSFYSLLLISILFLNYTRNIGAISISSNTTNFRLNANFIPFKTITIYIQSFINGNLNKSIIFQNLLGNLLLFSPMGILLPSLFKKLQKLKLFLLSLLIILISVEVGQLLTSSGSFDIDDIILNIAGAAFFYFLWSLNISQRFLRKIYIIK
ncbi:VanZ family protein [Clostridium sp. D2Q-11]|uniref:VanZ family protein n=1 Tax=Anaeromonas frigoriresistens TaxID=2683708 RepID=A0A942UWK9_9FIRM|nr:VanZ family protein [Anaeromonas frigoriresistens]MBS4536937.1 VanZ family protein [Anaeromonas frigoriresistens]